MFVSSTIYSQLCFIIVLLCASSEGRIQNNTFTPEEGPQLHILTMDMQSGQTWVSGSEDLFFQRRPLGSLMKITLVLASSEELIQQNPIFNCTASSVNDRASDTCWYRPGHGHLNMEQALAYSCNAWFRNFLQMLPESAWVEMIHSIAGYSVKKPDFVELTNGFILTPVQFCGLIATAFNGGTLYSLSSNNSGITVAAVGVRKCPDSAKNALFSGLALAAKEGTALPLKNRNSLVKTGTTWQTSGEKVNKTGTDGLCLLLYPANRPRYLVLVIGPGLTGAQTSKAVNKSWSHVFQHTELTK